MLMQAYPFQPSCDHSRSGKTHGRGSSATEVPILPDFLPLAAYTREEGCLKAVTEVSTKETINTWIYAAVEI